MSAEPISGAEIVIKALVDQGVDVVFGYPGGAVLPIYDALFKQNSLRHILVRHEAGRGPRRRGLCPLDRQGRRRAGDQRARRDQCGHRPDRRADGFGADRLPDRPGADASDRQRRVPGGRHDRHHPSLHQAQLSGQGRERSGAHDARGVLCRAQRPARPGGGRSAQGRAVRARALQPRPKQVRHKSYRPQLAARSGADRRGGRADRRAPNGRCSTAAAASSIPGPRPARALPSWCG